MAEADSPARAGRARRPSWSARDGHRGRTRQLHPRLRARAHEPGRDRPGAERRSGHRRRDLHRDGPGCGRDAGRAYESVKFDLGDTEMPEAPRSEVRSPPPASLPRWRPPAAPCARSSPRSARRPMRRSRPGRGRALRGAEEVRAALVRARSSRKSRWTPSWEWSASRAWWARSRAAESSMPAWRAASSSAAWSGDRDGPARARRLRREAGPDHDPRPG